MKDVSFVCTSNLNLLITASIHLAHLVVFLRCCHRSIALPTSELLSVTRPRVSKSVVHKPTENKLTEPLRPQTLLIANSKVCIQSPTEEPRSRSNEGTQKSQIRCKLPFLSF